MKALEGITVLEFASYVSGPYAGMMLSDLGARVWKIEALRARVAAQRGYLALLAAPPELRNKISPWGDLGGEAVLLRRLKAKFDPSAILAPGRFTG